MASHFVLVLIVALVVVGVHAAPLRWDKISMASGSPTPPRRNGAAMAYDRLRDQLVLFGGQGSGILSDTWIFSFVNSTWMQVGSGTHPEARFSMVGGMDQPSSGARDRFLVSTGEGPGKKLHQDVWALDLATRVWSRVDMAGHPPTIRYGSVGGTNVFAPDDGLIVDKGFGSERFPDTLLVQTNTALGSKPRWSEIVNAGSPPDSPFARCLHGGAVLSGGQLVTFGGCGSGGYGPCAAWDTWVLRGKQWTKGSSCPGPRIKPSMVPSHASPTSAILFGGKGGIYGDDEPGQVSIFDTDTNQWTSVIPDGPDSGLPEMSFWPAMALVNHNNASLDLSRDFVAMLQDDGQLWRLSGDPAMAPRKTVECRVPGVNLRLVHGVLMTLSWGFLLPLGVTIARFGKGLRRESTRQNQPAGAKKAIPDFWFVLHRGIQSLGLLLATAGLVVAILMVAAAKFSALPHAMIGAFVMLLGLLQPLNAFFRPHLQKDHPKSKKRIWWERIHKSSGWLAMFLGLINPFWGFEYIRADTTQAGRDAWLIIYTISATSKTRVDLLHDSSTKIGSGFFSFLVLRPTTYTSRPLCCTESPK